MAQNNPEEGNNAQVKITKNVTINGQVFAIDVEGTVDFKLTPRGGTIPDPEKPPVDPKPDTPTDFGTIKQGAKWSKNPGKAETWILKNMDNPSDQFKFISANDQGNIVANIKSKEDALSIQNHFKTNPFPPVAVEPDKPTDPGTGGTSPGSTGGTPGSTIALKYKAKQGGQNITEFQEPDYSVHSGKPRCSLYTKNKGAFFATNGQIGGYNRMKLGKKDQILYKLMSGGHGDNDTMGGRCYGVGFEIEGNHTALHAVKELNHPETPRITDKIEKLFTGTLPSLNGKTVGYRANHWVNKDGHTVVEFDADFSVLDTPPEQLKEAPNQWTPMFRFVDKGDWGLSKQKDEDTNIKENSGVTYPKAGKLGYYFRADEVNKGDGATALGQAIEIEAPN